MPNMVSGRGWPRNADVSLNSGIGAAQPAINKQQKHTRFFILTEGQSAPKDTVFFYICLIFMLIINSTVADNTAILVFRFLTPIDYVQVDND